MKSQVKRGARQMACAWILTMLLSGAVFGQTLIDNGDFEIGSPYHPWTAEGVGFLNAPGPDDCREVVFVSEESNCQFAVIRARTNVCGPDWPTSLSVIEQLFQIPMIGCSDPHLTVQFKARWCATKAGAVAFVAIENPAVEGGTEILRYTLPETSTCATSTTQSPWKCFYFSVPIPVDELGCPVRVANSIRFGVANPATFPCQPAGGPCGTLELHIDEVCVAVTSTGLLDPCTELQNQTQDDIGALGNERCGTEPLLGNPAPNVQLCLPLEPCAPFVVEPPFVECCDTVDINDDHGIGIADLLELLGQWGPCLETGTCRTTCTADTNCDGQVSIDDLLNLLADWGTFCL